MSRQKYSYVPEPQTDFIFSILVGTGVYRWFGCVDPVSYSNLARNEGGDESA